MKQSMLKMGIPFSTAQLFLPDGLRKMYDLLFNCHIPVSENDNLLNSKEE